MMSTLASHCSTNWHQAVLVLLCLSSSAVAAAPPLEVTIWLMPNEDEPYEPLSENNNLPVRSDASRSLDDLRYEIEQTKLLWGKDSPVTLLNVVEPEHLEQLIALNRQFVEPFWPVVKRQQNVLQDLKEFAKDKNIHINVRIITWEAAFQETRRILESDKIEEYRPDIVQVGTTWSAYFLENRLGIDSLPFLLDVRLFYYWKLMPRDSRRATTPSKSLQPVPPHGRPAEPLHLVTTSWSVLIEGLRSHVLSQDVSSRHPPIAFPILCESTNLIHDYSVLVWSGHGKFLSARTARLDLSMEPSLEVPCLIARNVSLNVTAKDEVRLFEFPEASHGEVTARFIDGYYGGCFEPIAFLRRLRREFREKYADLDFDTQVMIATPPVPFVGGSELMVTRAPKSMSSTEQLDRDNIVQTIAHHLAAGPHARHLSQWGQLPAQLKNEEYGLRTFLDVIPEGLKPEFKQHVVDIIHESLQRDKNGHLMRGGEYERFRDFPKVIENPRTRELLQTVLRRISVGDEQGIREAASAIDFEVNRQINNLTKWRYRIWLAMPWVGGIVMIAAVAYARNRYYEIARHRDEALLQEKILRRENEAADAARQSAEERNKALGFTSMQLTIVDEIHKNYHFPFKCAREAEKSKLLKAAWVLNAMRELRRAQLETSWQDEALQDVVWRSILHAIDSVRSPGIFAEWQDRCDGAVASKSIPDFLTTASHKEGTPDAHKSVRGFLRAGHAGSAALPYFHFDVQIQDQFIVKIPFLLEQAIACLLQNALQASYDHTPHYFHSVSIQFLSDDVPRLVIKNRNVTEFNGDAQGVPDEIAAIVNSNPEIPQFVSAITNLFLLETPDKWPGIGLVHAFTILRQFYGGMEIASKDGSTMTTVWLTQRS